VDTGESTLTGGRLRRVAGYLDDAPFCFTYGDGVADVDVTALIDFHRREGRWATLTAVQPPGRFGSLAFERGRVLSFEEKPQGDGSWINGGFFVLEPEVLTTISGDESVWERDCLPVIAEAGQLNAYEHNGFWQPMDTLRDRQLLEELWQAGRAPWKTW
jgi:glucose-1-phosphate cytidylyltransferase